MSEFKVGDSVRLKEGLIPDRYYGDLPYTKSKYFEGSSKIDYINEDGNIGVEKTIFLLSTEMIELVIVPLTLSEIIERNYQAAVRRGQITDNTTVWDFITKMEEELKELKDSINEFGDFDVKELADYLHVGFAMGYHYQVDTIKVMEEKTIFNEQRED